MTEVPITITPADEFGIQEDHFDRLWTPQRMAYVASETPRAKNGDACPFCEAPKRSDEDGLIVYRGKTAYVLMNLFPYNSAHLLVCPIRHVSLYYDATPEERAEIAELTSHALEALKAEMNCDGFNIGINQGEAAGAGIAAHLHQHIVPRWAGDANFFPIIAKTKAIPNLIEVTRERLQNAW